MACVHESHGNILTPCAGLRLSCQRAVTLQEMGGRIVFSAYDIGQDCSVRRWQVFSALCRHLRSGMLGGRGGVVPRTSWKELFQAARVHVVVPSLSWCLRDEKSVPPEFRSYLDAVTRLNAKRNDRLYRQLEQVAGALNDIDIEPTLLKGAAHLIGELYPSSAARLMGDLDILVPQERGRDAFAAMEAIGFALDVSVSDTHHHLPAMRHSETNIVIELHTRLLHARSEPILPASWVHEQARSVALGGSRVKVPPPTIMIAHNVVHDQLNHERYAWKQVELRQLLDLAMLRARYEREIDWGELDRRFNDAGMGRVLATYLHYGEVLFGQSMPAVRSAPRAKAIHRLRSAMEFPLRERILRRHAERARRLARREARQRAAIAVRAFCGRWTRRAASVATLPWYYVKERRRNPRGLVRMVDPRAWRQRFRLIVRNLKELQ